MPRFAAGLNNSGVWTGQDFGAISSVKESRTVCLSSRHSFPAEGSPEGSGCNITKDLRNFSPNKSYPLPTMALNTVRWRVTLVATTRQKLRKWEKRVHHITETCDSQPLRNADSYRLDSRHWASLQQKSVSDVTTTVAAAGK